MNFRIFPTSDLLRPRLVFAALTLLLLLVGCDTRDKRIPERNAPMALELRYPRDGLVFSGDSIAMWGTVGTGRATLTLNGAALRVERNGAFADFIPLPTGDTARLEFAAQRGDDTIRKTIHIVRRVAASGEKRSDAGPRPYERWVRLRRLPSDTADSATQWRPIYTRWAPGGAIALPIAQGVRLFADARADDAIRLALAPGASVWIPNVDADTTATARARTLQAGAVRVSVSGDETILSLPLPEQLPTTVEMVRDRMVWTIFGAKAESTQSPAVPANDVVRDVAARDVGQERIAVELSFATEPLGWKTEWRDSALVLRIRSQRPLLAGLEGLIVAVDAGHPPDGSTGPAGLTEDSLTLAVARRVAERLSALGARPFLVRTDEKPVSLEARPVRAEQAGTHVFISIHANTPGAGKPPATVRPTQVFFVHPQSIRLAMFVSREVKTALEQAELTIEYRDFVVTRSSWYPAILVEGMAIALPDREALLRTTQGVDAYAGGIVKGLRGWVSVRQKALRDSLR